MISMRAILIAAMTMSVYGVALAKLPPAPPMTDAQKQEVAAKKAATAAKDAAELARAQDRAVQNYAANERAKGVQVNLPGAMATGAKPGAVATKPASTKATPEKAMAHSPPAK